MINICVEYLVLKTGTGILVFRVFDAHAGANFLDVLMQFIGNAVVEDFPEVAVKLLLSATLFVVYTFAICLASGAGVNDLWKEYLYKAYVMFSVGSFRRL